MRAGHWTRTDSELLSAGFAGIYSKRQFGFSLEVQDKKDVSVQYIMVFKMLIELSFQLSTHIFWILIWNC